MTTKTRFAPSRRALLLIATVALGLSGCGIGPSNPPAQIYVLDPEFTALPDAPKVDWGLAIGRPDVADVYDTERVALQRGQTMDYYADAQWTDSAPRLLQSLFVEAFEKSGKIGAVARDGGGVHDDYILATEVRHFEAQYDSGNPAPNVVVDIEAKLLTLPHRDVVAVHDVRHEARAGANSVPAVIAAYNQATGAAIEEIAAWTLRAQGGPTPAASDATPAPVVHHRRHRRR
jgi:cholesterol transport system auxiliary component